MLVLHVKAGGMPLRAGSEARRHDRKAVRIDCEAVGATLGAQASRKKQILAVAGEAVEAQSS